MDEDSLKSQLVNFLKSTQAHMPLSEAEEDFPLDKINLKPPNVDYTFWHLIEHLRRTQKDILGSCTNPNYEEPSWPEDYWPGKNEKATEKDWDKSVSDFEKDLKEMVNLVENPKIDLYSKIPWGDGQTILREAMLVFDHNAYHIGELAILRQVCNAWPEGRD